MQEILVTAICSVMEELDVSRAELSRRLGVSRSAVTQMLDNERWTLDRFEQVASALGAHVKIGITLPKEENHGA